MKRRFLAVCVPFLACGVCAAAETKNDDDRINYAIGYQIGGDLKNQGVELNADLLLQGVRDAVQKKDPAVPRDQMTRVLMELKRKVVAMEKSKAKQDKQEYLRTGAEFLKANAAKEGVKTLPSGVQYRVVRQGSGRKPTLKDEVDISYRISRIDGKEMGSTYAGGSPKRVELGQALPGLQEVLQLMPEGSKWEVVFPTAKTLGGGKDSVEEFGAVIYDMELVSVIGSKK